MSKREYLLKYRGNKEVETMIAKIAQEITSKKIPVLDQDWLDFLKQNDLDILDWIFRRKPWPNQYSLIALAASRVFTE